MKALHTSAVLAALLAACGSARAEGPYECPAVAAGKIEGNYFKTRIFQGKDGWFFREGSDVADFYSYGPDTLGYVGRFARALKARDVQLVFLPVPPKGLIEPQFAGDAVPAEVFDRGAGLADLKTLLAEVKEAGAIPVDVLSAEAKSEHSAFFFARDLHWRPEGARIGAAAARAALQPEALYGELSKKGYQTSVVAKEQPMRSAVLQALQRMCTDTLPQEHTDLYETAAGEATADDLLGGDENTPVALVGTSFSDVETFNFAGFLSEALELEVANFAISGGGTFTSVLSYTLSDNLDKMPPKYLVWENPAYNRLDGEGISSFRQMIPAVTGYCSGAAKLETGTLSLAAGQRARLPVTAQGVSGHGYYLAMKASDSGLKQLTFDIDYDDGDGETFVVNRSDRQKASERFFLEFSDDIPGSVTGVSVTAPKEVAVDLEISICQAPKGGDL